MTADEDLVRPAARPDDPVPDQHVGAILLLRDASAARLLHDQAAICSRRKKPRSSTAATPPSPTSRRSSAGSIADRWLGKRRAVIHRRQRSWPLGHFMMAFEPLSTSRWRRSRSATACFCRACRARSTISTRPTIRAADWAYNVYYVGVNLGGFLAPLVCGTLGEIYGWHYGFGAAGVGMLAGLVIYLWGQNYLPRETPPANRAASAKAENRDQSSRRMAPSFRNSNRGHHFSRRLRADWQYHPALD